jgi:hypothetical protein
MKNIHILPTDKPSRLALQLDCKPSYNLQLSKVADLWTKNWEKQNIYIASDEEIKEGDWYESGKYIWKMRYPKWGEKGQGDAKKIIITTDQDLIKDAVQAIDDEFLEWFVNNPSCEEVETKQVFADGSTFGYNENLRYKIIIPKEEPKQETLEEAINSYVYKTSNEQKLSEILENAIRFGAKWQQEQILYFLYEEITERRDYSASKMCEKITEFILNLK